MGNKFYNNGGQSKQRHDKAKDNKKPIEKTKETATAILNNMSNYNSLQEWVKTGVTEETIKFAYEVSEQMAKNKLTSSKLRGIYSEVKRIQEKKYENEKSSFLLLKPKLAYAVGRDSGNIGLYLFKIVLDKTWVNVNDANTYKNFCDIMEAIVAYHKYYDEKYNKK